MAVPPFEAASAAAGTYLESFARHCTSAIVIADLATGRIDFFNPAAMRIWTRLDAIALLAEWSASIHPVDRDETIRRREHVAATGQCHSFQYRIVDAIGNTARRLRETCFCIPNESGQCSTVGCIVEDVSPDVPVYLVQKPGTPDPDLRHALQGLVTRLTTFSSQEDLLELANVLSGGCIVADLRGGTMDSGSIGHLLKAKPDNLELILIGPQATPPEQIIAALKAGAVDYLVEPLDVAALAAAIQRSSPAAMNAIPGRSESNTEVADRIAQLSRREREVLSGIILGESNKTIARSLSISPRTVETHRASLMQRMNVRNLTQLLNLAHQAGLGNPVGKAAR